MEALKLLVAEQDPKLALAFNKLIKKYKIDGIVVNSGVDAYKSLYKYNFDYIIINIELPDENGVDIINFIREKFTSKIIV